MPKFKVGEIAIIKDSSFPELVGRECEIIEYRGGENKEYVIHIHGKKASDYGKNYKRFLANESSLCKRPDKDTPTSWEDCIWKPSKETV